MTVIPLRSGPSHPDRRDASYPVLSGRIDKNSLDSTSRFVDDVWYLGPAERLTHTPPKSLHFGKLPAQFRITVKQMFVALLDGRPPSKTSAPLALTTIRKRMISVKEFLVFLDARNVSQLSDVTSAQLAEYVGHLQRSGRLHTERLRGPLLFWDLREFLDDPLPFDPASLPVWTAPSRRTPAENTTDRVPEAVLEPLLWWSAWFVQHLAADVIAARSELRSFVPPPPLPRGATRGAALVALDAFLDEMERNGRPLPGQPEASPLAGVNRSEIDRLAGVRQGTAGRSRRERIAHLAAVNGVESDSYLQTPSTAMIGGALWARRISRTEAVRAPRLLRAACYTLIAFFSGMRDAEVKHLRVGCVAVDQDDTGKLSVHLLRGATFKGNSDRPGRTATWVVAPIVHEAIAVLESIGVPGDDRLFHPDDFASPQQHWPQRAAIITVAETNSMINDLISWINDRVDSLGHGVPIPNVDGQPWRITTRQFRRTLAWFIARKPGGIAAGALQYKHLSIQMFRGYAGTSQSGFADEVRAEQAMERGEWLGGFADEAATTVGRARDEVVRRLDQWREATGFAGHLPDNPKQLAKLLAKFDPYVYRGAAVTCVFDPSKALCLARSRATDAPDLASCEPLKCANSVFTPEQVGIWRDRAQGLQALSADETLTPFVRARAAEHAERLIAVFDRIEQSSD
ncbi:hypothetical protein NYQ31_11845 [Curtobacterium flaccumfaciens]|uniref:hypothetical protein n=1 Tax=Curtobacterium flaccumfaciens TaxID=2035 RepID=UPI00217D04C0|nr:hypothetical protein [Curtobacterium flaccumfaciens]MCS6559092.1 hypothetical protein [Curtobacterium flaccumfaciens]